VEPTFGAKNTITSPLPQGALAERYLAVAEARWQFSGLRLARDI
jgi:hypothetical protein